MLCNDCGVALVLRPTSLHVLDSDGRARKRRRTQDHPALLQVNRVPLRRAPIRAARLRDRTAPRNRLPVRAAVAVEGVLDDPRRVLHAQRGGARHAAAHAVARRVDLNCDGALRRRRRCRRRRGAVAGGDREAVV